VGVSRYLDLSGKISVLGGAASRVLDSRPSFGPGTARGRAGAGHETCHASWPRGGFPGLVPILEKGSTDEKIQRALSPYYDDVTCPDCGGTRLNRQARSVDFKGRTITQMVDLSIRDFQELWKSIEFTEAEHPVGLPILRESRGRWPS